MERLESRALLAITNLAAIQGVASSDQTGDGLTADDIRQENATVELYRDGGNGSFDNGVGDDTLVGFDMTDATGTYRFDSLTEGRYFARQLPIAGLMQQSGADVATVDLSAADVIGVAGTMIDDFSTPTAGQSLIANNTNPTVSSSVAAAGAIGGERDIFLQRTSASGSIGANVNDDVAGMFAINPSANASGNVTITWDGADNDATTLVATGLGGVDLTDAGTSVGLHLQARTDHDGVIIQLRIYSNATSFSDVTLTLPNVATLDDTLVRFSSLSQGATATAPVDLTNVGAIEVRVLGVPEADGQIDVIAARGPTVEAANFTNFEPLSVGNLVFNDANNNGQFDAAAEVGIPNVDVELYADTDGNNVFTPGVDQFQATDTTDGAGNYRFDNLFPGDYVLRITPANFGGGGALIDVSTSSTGNQPTSDPDNNTNNLDDNGDPLAGQGVVSQAITLTANAEPTNDGDASSDSNLTVDFGFFQPIDVQITKSDNPDPVNAGSQLTYTLTITNNGPEPASGVTVTDPLPAGVSFASGTASQGSVSANGNTVTANLGTLASGATATITLTVNVANGTTGTISNNASVTANEFDTNLLNNSDIEPTDVTPVIDLRIAKSDTPDPVDAGSPLTYTILVTNDGPSTATGVVVSDTLPAGVTFASGTTSQGTVGHAAGVVTANVGTLANGATATLTLLVNVANSTTGTITNVTTVTGNETELNAANNRAEAPTTVRPVVDLVVTKLDDIDPVDAGSPFAYTMTVTNNGPSTATGVTLTDPLPAGITFVSATTSQGSVTNVGNNVTTNLGTLASGATATITFNVSANASASGTVTNTATVTANEFETNAANNQASEPTTIVPVVDLLLVKTDNPDPVNAGAAFSYTVSITNNGPSAATGVTLADSIPAGLTFVSANTSHGSVLNVGNNLTGNLGTLASGVTATITINVTANASTSGTVTNTATVTSNERELNNTNNTDSEPTTIVPVVDLTIAKTDSPDPVNAGATLTYTLTITNNGPSGATGVSVTDTLPPEVTFVSATPSQGTASHNNGVISANLGSLANGGQATIVVTVAVANNTRGTITNTAIVSASQTETNPANNQAIEPTTVTPVVDLTITKADDIDPIFANGTLTYTLLVTNNGPSTATGVTVTDPLPAGITFSSGSASQGSVTAIGQNLTASLGTLASGATATISVITQVLPTTVGLLTNTATVTASETETNPANNSDTETTFVNPLVDVLITKADSPDPVVAGQTLTYTLVVTNNGPSTATGVTVNDPLPANLSFVSGSTSQGTINHSNGTVTVNVGTLASGASATVSIVGTVNPAARGTLTNTSTVTVTETDSNPANNADTEPTTIVTSVDLAVIKTDSPDPVLAGNQLTYTINITNNGPSTATGVTLSDPLPNGVTFVSAVPTQGTAANNSGTVTANLGTLASGATATVIVTVTVVGTTLGPLENEATVTGNEPDPDPNNNRSRIPTTVTPVVDVSITKNDSPDPVDAGGALTYSMTITNNGPSTATGVTVSDLLPTGVTFVSGNSTQGSVSHSNGTVAINLGTLANSGTATVTLLVNVGNSVTGTLTNTATVAVNQTETNLANNTASAVTTVRPIVDLVITKADLVDPIFAGETISYTMTVTNNGPSTATGIVVSDAIPAGLTFVSGTSSQGSIAHSAGIFTAQLGTLASGASATITLIVQSASTASGTVTNTAVVTAAQTETNTANNTASAVTTIQPLASIAGIVFVDRNVDGSFNSNDELLPGVTVSLIPIDDTGLPTGLAITQQTGADGAYRFGNLAPGRYRIEQTQPAMYLSGADSLGSLGGVNSVVTDSRIDAIVLTPGTAATDYNFAEVIPVLTKRRFLASATNR